jgi:hypothetical protein
VGGCLAVGAPCVKQHQARDSRVEAAHVLGVDSLVFIYAIGRSKPVPVIQPFWFTSDFWCCSI